MTYEEIEEQYYIVCPLKRQDKTILYCRSIKDGEYAFFVDEGTKYVLVDNQLKIELMNIYKIKNDTVAYDISEDKEISQAFSKATPQEIFACGTVCKQNISRLKCFLSEKTYKKLITNLESVNVKTINEYEALSKCPYNLNHVAAFYSPSVSTVFLKKNWTPSSYGLTVFQHELLHASSVDEKKFRTGLSYTIQSESGSHISSFSGINEAVTEYLNHFLSKSFFYTNVKYKHSDNNFSYVYLVNLTNILIKQCKIEAVLDAYINNDPESLISHIQDTFHLTGNKLIMEFLYCLDALFSYSVNKTEQDEDDLDILLYNSYVKLAEMTANKFKYEKVDAKLLDFDNLFENLYAPYKSKEKFEYIKSDIKPYFYDLLSTNTTFANSDYMNKYFAKLIILFLDNQRVFIPEQMRTKEMFSWLFSSYVVPKEFEDDFVDRVLCSSSIMPLSHEKRNEIYSYLIMTSSAYPYDIIDKIPFQNLIQIIEDDPEMLKKIIIKEPSTAFYCFKGISPNLIKSDLIEFAVKNGKSFNNASKKDYLTGLYTSIPNSIKKTDSFKKFFLNKLEENFPSQFYDNIKNDINKTNQEDSFSR